MNKKYIGIRQRNNNVIITKLDEKYKEVINSSTIETNDFFVVVKPNDCLPTGYILTTGNNRDKIKSKLSFSFNSNEFYKINDKLSELGL